MNTVGAVTLVLAFILFLIVIGWLIKLIIKADDKSERIIYSLTLVFAIVMLAFTILASLNFYGYARIPLFNQVTSKVPRYATPVEVAEPPVAGSLQPSSKPVIEDHKERMERLKRDGW